MEKKVSSIEQKQIMLEILDYIDAVCVAEGIPYSLSGGTLLGALRHKGFIPWDDDMDIMLTRNNYDHLLQVLAKESSEYTLLHYSVKGYRYVFAKLCSRKTFQKSPNREVAALGVFVDIFPIDAMPTNAEERRAFILEMKKQEVEARLADFYSYPGSETNLRKWVKTFLYFPKWWKLSREETMHERLKKLDENIQKYDDQNTQYAGFVCSQYALTNELYPREIFSDYIYYDFEDRKYQGIRNAEVYLEQLYGDYMKMPPKSKQINHEFYQWYWKNDQFEEA